MEDQIDLHLVQLVADELQARLAGDQRVLGILGPEPCLQPVEIGDQVDRELATCKTRR